MDHSRKEFSDKVRDGLLHMKDEVTNNIRNALSRDLPGVEVLQFSIFSGNEGLPVTLFGMNADRSEEILRRDDAGELDSVLCENLSDSFEEFIDEDEIIDFSDSSPDGEPELAGFEMVSRVIAEFIRECYLEAGGADHPLPCVAQHEDSLPFLDLKTGQWN
ncbi:MAG: hypothetical protein AAFN77_12510 [Planctomycetota bacterium]